MGQHVVVHIGGERPYWNTLIASSFVIMAEHRHREFVIETFQLGANLWNTRVRRLDSAVITYGGISCHSLYLGDSWPTPAAAFDDAKEFIDRMSTSKPN